jgi:Ca2+-binding EF-hand superfamily protein
VTPRKGVELNAPTVPDPIADLFKKADLNNDGALDCDDVARLLIRLRALATESSEDDDWLVPSEQEINAAMWGMDTDRSGAVSIDEFRKWFVRQGGLEYASNPALWEPDEDAEQPEHAYKRTAAVLTPARNATDEQLASYYRQLDLDNDNKLDATEVGKLLAKLRASGTSCGEDEEWLAPSAQEVRSAMKAMDTDGNNTVSQTEFSDWFSKQGGWDYASSPALWGDGSDSDDDEEEEEPILPATARRNLNTAWKQTEDDDVDASVAALFGSQDSSGDGVLDRAEVCELLYALRQRAINGESGETPDAADGAEEQWVRPTG